MNERTTNTRAWLAAALALLVTLTLAGVGTARPAPKVDVCHYDAESGTFELINISGNAFGSHIAHGDAAPGQAVPGMTGYEFGPSSCAMELVRLTASLSQETIWANGGIYENSIVQNAIDLGYAGTVVMSRPYGSDAVTFNFSFANLNPDETYKVYFDSNGGTAGSWIVLGTFGASGSGGGAFSYNVTLPSGSYNWSFWVNQSAPPASVLQTNSDLSFRIP